MSQSKDLLCTAVLLTEFHIDLGSIVQAQWMDEEIQNRNGKAWRKVIPSVSLPAGSHQFQDGLVPFIYHDEKEGDVYFGISHFKSMKKLELKRSVRVKSISLLSKKREILWFGDEILNYALNEIFALEFVEGKSSDDVSIKYVLRDVYQTINSVLLPKVDFRTNNALSKCMRIKKDETQIVGMDYRKNPIQVNLPKFRENVLNFIPLSLVKLVKTFKERIMILFNALLLERNIIFLGYGSEYSASDVSSALLSSLKMVNVLSEENLLKKRVFPYACMSYIESIEKTKGMIVGASNPIIKQKSDWFDCCVDLSSSEIIVNEDSKYLLEFITSEDKQFINSVLILLDEMEKLKENTPTFIENIVENHFHRFTMNIVNVAYYSKAGILPRINVISQNSERKNINHIELSTSESQKAHLFQKTISFNNLKRERSQMSIPIALTSHIFKILKIRNQKSFSPRDVIETFHDFYVNIVSEDDVIWFLEFFPLAADGLDKIGIFLLTKEVLARFYVYRFLKERIRACPIGKIAFNNLNTMYILLYEEATKEFEEFSLAPIQDSQ